MQRGRCHGKREPAGRVLSTTANKRQGNETEERGPAPLPRRTLLSPSPPPEREHADWRVRVCAHANDGCALEAVDGTSEQDRAPRKRAVSLAQCASMGHGPTPTSAAERARRKRACCASSRGRARRVAYSCVRTRECRLLIGGRGWHVEAGPCTEGDGRLAGAVGFHRT